MKPKNKLKYKVHIKVKRVGLHKSYGKFHSIYSFYFINTYSYEVLRNISIYKDILISLLGHEIKIIYILDKRKSPSHLFYRRAL